jgi:pimeloyl-ACP methyl ester carboxylesterase
MKTCLLVNGSPGAPSELDPLRDALTRRDVKAEILRMPLADATPVYAPIVAAAQTADAIIAYSYGCYLTLRAHQDGALPGKPVVLVNPHLVASDGISGVVGFLLGLPVVGKSLIGKGLPQRVDEHLAKVFAPATPPDNLRKELGDPDLWLRAARWKQTMATTPLSPIDPASFAALRIVIGTADGSSPWQHHTGTFKTPPADAIITRVDGAGHALHVTHPDRVADVAVALLRA